MLELSIEICISLIVLRRYFYYHVYFACHIKLTCTLLGLVYTASCSNRGNLDA
jgi:hypothetical protein